MKEPAEKNSSCSRRTPSHNINTHPTTSTHTHTQVQCLYFSLFVWAMENRQAYSINSFFKPTLTHTHTHTHTHTDTHNLLCQQLLQTRLTNQPTNPKHTLTLFRPLAHINTPPHTLYNNIISFKRHRHTHWRLCGSAQDIICSPLWLVLILCTIMSF